MRVIFVHVLAVGIIGTSDAFVSPRRWSRPTSRRGGGSGGGNNKPPVTPRTPRFNLDPSDDDGDGVNRLLLAGVVASSFEEDRFSCTFEESASNTTCLQIRGGSSIQSKLAKKKGDIVEGAKKSMEDTLSYWSDVVHFLTTPFRSIMGKGGPRRRKVGKEERDAVEQFEAVVVKAVKAPNSTLLPPEVIQSAAQKSGLLGGSFRPESVEECARLLREWYRNSGYILNQVTGANVQTESSTVELVVEEATTSSKPVGISFAKEMFVDGDTGEVMTYRQAVRKVQDDKESGKESNLNSTIVETGGRTSAAVLAKALGLKPGKPFMWETNRWDHIEGSGIFSRVLSSGPQKMDDGTVQLNFVVTETPSRNLEYGITKGLYNDVWEGEIGLENRNLLGGGDTLSLMVKRGAKEPEPSFRLRFSGNKLRLSGGYDVEAFNDYIGVKEMNNDGNVFSRKGLTIRVSNPIPPGAVRQSSTSASIERTSTKSGQQDLLANGKLDVGPFYQNLPRKGRSNIQTSVTVGTHLVEKEGGSIAGSYNLDPYSLYTATTRQVLPITSPDDADRRPITLALQHSAFASGGNLPQHEANAAGIAARVRGYTSRSNGPVSSSVVGTAEVRIPIPTPSSSALAVGNVNLILFGDWMRATEWAQPSHHFRKSSVGIGLRSATLGVPMKLDFSLTEDGKVGTHFSLGRDFDA